ncbi:hypothetical protein NEOC84_000583|nr:hypothetical protein [Neochlamydia sp. AcF95]NGY94692.1 hypothetical protein [Neochlamydia sp. AcF84]
MYFRKLKNGRLFLSIFLIYILLIKNCLCGHGLLLKIAVLIIYLPKVDISP